MNIVTIAVINNEWYMVYDINTKEIITLPYYVNNKTSATVGISENIKIEVASTEDELLNLITQLGLIIKEE